ncbi:MAG: hypothetical protein KF832_17595 [Caldilineaceae bacterium]|nr:hypothetical protein [Caldilineaceae bacterium]
MKSIRVGASVLYLASLLPLYLQWSKQQAEGQIDKMQSAVFNSPGAESTLTPAVVAGGVTLLGSHFVIARKGLELDNGEALSTMFLGGVLGFLTFYWLWPKDAA